MALNEQKHEDMFAICNCCPKGELSREEFNIQVNKINYFEESSQLLSPATSVIDQYVNKVSTLAGMEVTHGLSNTDFHSPRPAVSTPSARSQDQH